MLKDLAAFAAFTENEFASSPRKRCYTICKSIGDVISLASCANGFASVWLACNSGGSR